jgi:hypothetical protein
VVGRLNKEVALGTAEVHRFDAAHISVRDEDFRKIEWLAAGESCESRRD